MRILLAHQKAFIGGGQTWTIALVRALGRLGHECEVFFFERGPIENELPAGIAAHFGGLADCIQLVRRRSFEIVHAATADWDVGVSAVRRFCPSAKLVLTMHGGLTPYWTSANCDALAGCSHGDAQEQQKWTDLPVQMVLNGVDTQRFVPGRQIERSGPPIVAWVGRGWDLKQKRIDVLALAAPSLHRAGVRLWIADPEGSGKVAVAATGALRPLTEFWGGVPHDQMPRFYQEVAASGGCVLSTSAFEGLPMALLEAQACGCPVIGPAVRGVQECVSSAHGGLLYPGGLGPEDLARVVLAALGDQALMRERGEACASYVRQRFGLERMAQDYLRIYREAPYTPCRRAWTGRTYQDYLERRWVPGHCLYVASQRLGEYGDWPLAARVARASLTTCPTLYLRQRRFRHLLYSQMNGLFTKLVPPRGT